MLLARSGGRQHPRRMLSVCFSACDEVHLIIVTGLVLVCCFSFGARIIPP